MADIRSTPEEDGWGEATIKTVLMGDFYKNPTLTGLGVRAVVTSIPVLDQLADAQDIAAWVIQCRDEGMGSLQVKLGGLLLGIGLIPTIGSAGKAVLKSLDSNAGIKAVIKALENLNFLGQGNAFKWLKEFKDELPSHGKKAAEFITTALTKLQELITELMPHVPASLLPKLNDWMASVAELQAAVAKMFKEAAEHYKTKLDEALSKFKKEEVTVPSKGTVGVLQEAKPVKASTRAMKLGPDQADQVIQGKYGQYLGEGKQGANLARDNVHVVDDADFSEAVRRGGADPDQVGGADGVLNPDGSVYVRGSGGRSGGEYADHAVMHESLHKYSDPAFGSQTNTGLDEGVTEWLARKEGMPNSDAYGSTTTLTGRLAKRVGEENLQKAYFSGDVSALRVAYEANPLPDAKTWDALLRKFDAVHARDTE